MNELKAHNINDLSLHDIANCEFYLKSEADKEIEFWKKESHDHYERWFSLNKQYEGWFGKVMRCERAERESRHQKYKRCLNKAEWCEERCARYDLLQEHSGLSWRREIDFYFRWYQRWLELAEKFKEEAK